MSGELGGLHDPVSPDPLAGAFVSSRGSFRRPLATAPALLFRAAGGEAPARLNAERGTQSVYTRAEATRRLDQARTEFAAVYTQQPREDMTAAQVTRVLELRDKITVLRNHVARLDKFAAVLARCGQGDLNG